MMRRARRVDFELSYLLEDAALTTLMPRSMSFFASTAALSTEVADQIKQSISFLLSLPT